jgi:hypothetical protein
MWIDVAESPTQVTIRPCAEPLEGTKDQASPVGPRAGIAAYSADELIGALVNAVLRAKEPEKAASDVLIAVRDAFEFRLEVILGRAFRWQPPEIRK